MNRRRRNGGGTLIRRTPKGPWIAFWYDYAGKRRERSTRTTDRAAAERVLAKLVADEALKRAGVVDPRQDRLASEARKSIDHHIEAYLTHCRQTNQAKTNISQKQMHLARLCEAQRLQRLTDLTPERLVAHMASLRDEGLSARTANFARQIALAFTSWCVRTGRLDNNPLLSVPKADEQRDRRRVRRALTDEELARLLTVAEAGGRKAWYMAAVLAGLRKGDLQRLRWRDVDFEAATITITHGKAHRTDVLPMHPQLADELLQRREESMATPSARIFPQTVTDLTRQKDFLRAGMAHEVVVTDEQGQPVMIGKGRRRRPKTRISTEDAEGRVIDLHALRTTLGTQLARAGVAPQIAQRIMRHSDYKTTLDHYTVLGLHDTAGAIRALPEIRTAEVVQRAATGTHGPGPAPHTGPQKPQRAPQQRERQTPPFGAPERTGGDEECADVGEQPGGRDRGLSPDIADFDASGGDADTMSAPTAGVTQLVECQPSKLNVEGSSPFARFVRLVPFRPPPGSDTRQRRTSVQCRLLVLWVAVGAIGVLAAPAAPVWAQSGGPAGPGVDPAVVERVRQAIATIELFKVGSVTESAYEQADRVLLDHADVALSLLVQRLSEPEASLIEVLIEDLLDAGADVTVLRPPLTGRDATARANALDIASDIDVSIEPLLSEIIGCINDPELFVRAETSLVLKELLPTLDDPTRARAQSELGAMLVQMPENEYIPGLLEMLNEPWWLRWRLKIALSLVGVALLGAMVAVWSQRRRSSGRLT